MTGFRINIGLEDTYPGVARHFSGYHPAQSGAIFQKCPCCCRQMFPALNLDFTDSPLSSLNLWPQRFLNILFCPSCGLYMKPYWICYKGEEIEIIGGDRSSDEILLEIEAPFCMREISLRELNPEEEPFSASMIRSYRNRTREEGVYHQIGGYPIRGQSTVLSCIKCAGNMRFAGILDYDDLNIPLYESGHRPVALIIGDGDCINFYTCSSCQVIGLKWIY